MRLRDPQTFGNMANLSIILPCAVLGGICAGMLIFIWWWFPRTWKKGNKQEGEAIGLSLDEIGSDGDGLTQEERRRIAGQEAREYLQAVMARNKAREEGRETDEPPPVYHGRGGVRRNGPPPYRP